MKTMEGIAMGKKEENNTEEYRFLNADKLNHVAGGEGDDDYVHLIEKKSRCPICGSDRYYSYTQLIMGEQYTVYRCPDCGYHHREAE